MYLMMMTMMTMTGGLQSVYKPSYLRLSQPASQLHAGPRSSMVGLYLSVMSSANMSRMMGDVAGCETVSTGTIAKNGTVS